MEEMMASAGEVVFKKRSEFIAEFIPTFQSFYSYISQDKEKVNLAYESHAMMGDCWILSRRAVGATV